MYHSEINIRVRYADTDQMKIVYYGNYAQYYEMGRVEAMRSLGISYKQLEESGIMMPVVEMNTRFKKPFGYDDSIRVVTTISNLPSRTIRFDYQLFNEENELCNEGFTTLVFQEIKTGRLVLAPENLKKALHKFVNL